MSRAIDLLEESPLASGDYGPGDLLQTVLAVSASFWTDHPTEWWRLKAIVDGLAATIEEIRIATETFERAAPPS